MAQQNPLMGILSPQTRPNNPLAILSEFRKFAAGMTPQQAKQQVEQLLKSGKMSQQQFQQLQEQAKEFMQFLR